MTRSYSFINPFNRRLRIDDNKNGRLGPLALDLLLGGASLGLFVVLGGVVFGGVVLGGSAIVGRRAAVVPRHAAIVAARAAVERRRSIEVDGQVGQRNIQPEKRD